MAVALVIVALAVGFISETLALFLTGIANGLVLGDCYVCWVDFRDSRRG